MTGALDYAALFAAIPAPCLVMGPDLVIVEANAAYLETIGRGRQELLGRHVFEVFPENPADPEAEGARNLRASLQRVLKRRVRDVVAPQKYDIPQPGNPGVFEERWWSPINTPVLGPDGEVAWIIQRVEDITGYVRDHEPGRPPDTSADRMRAMEIELFARARELKELNDELRQAHAEERQVALALQRSMLHAPDAERHREIAVCYMPATHSLNVCGDWYDVADVSEDRVAVAVGDVVGHGLKAATIMGMLRSALSATIRASEGPARALEALERYAESIEGALGTTAVKALIDKRAHAIVYSSAGHPPPILLHPDGTTELLDQVVDPPLGALMVQVPRSQASVLYKPGDALVLYTDGLIERPGEDIDVGLERLTTALSRSVGVGVEHITEAVLDELGMSEGPARDDIAMLVIFL
ncbi:PP2C family protein-serine/threonine phosphatase [Streptomyces palmae]|uniref:PAS domain-containing protein n=1 Tax=Streptomyces palmae TaxID=1701085 RepID=A0A4Z0HGK0_9ACTN|nr:SpoIIE family protein phosphatase [Streptomyces palmae]TGB19390.1 PAS domain-containing protein [Streptomyces palmae]